MMRFDPEAAWLSCDGCGIDSPRINRAGLSFAHIHEALDITEQTIGWHTEDVPYLDGRGTIRRDWCPSCADTPKKGGRS